MKQKNDFRKRLDQVSEENKLIDDMLRSIPRDALLKQALAFRANKDQFIKMSEFYRSRKING